MFNIVVYTVFYNYFFKSLQQRNMVSYTASGISIIAAQLFAMSCSHDIVYVCERVRVTLIKGALT